jgi:hypothetical protein
MRKFKPPKNDELEEMSEYDNTDGSKNINKNILIEPIIAITRARRTGINTLFSSQPNMQRIIGIKISPKTLLTSENLQRTEEYLKKSHIRF